MARNIHSTYYEDNYVKYECHDCKRKFIVGERLSEGKSLTCPYCQSSEIESTAIADETNTEEMQMGCAGIYFHTYADGTLMLYTEKEFVRAMNAAFFDKGIKSVPLGGHHSILKEFCEKRDNRGSV